jgi:hypothetical protein
MALNASTLPLENGTDIEQLLNKRKHAKGSQWSQTKIYTANHHRQGNNMPHRSMPLPLNAYSTNPSLGTVTGACSTWYINYTCRYKD